MLISNPASKQLRRDVTCKSVLFTISNNNTFYKTHFIQEKDYTFQKNLAFPKTLDFSIVLCFATLISLSKKKPSFVLRRSHLYTILVLRLKTPILYYGNTEYARMRPLTLGIDNVTFHQRLR